MASIRKEKSATPINISGYRRKALPPPHYWRREPVSRSIGIGTTKFGITRGRILLTIGTVLGIVF